MAYRLIVSERADELIDSSIYYIVNKLKNSDAALHLLDEISSIYDRLEDNPYQFGDSKDDYLRSKGYREAIVTGMQYKIVFRVDNDKVYIVGLFHDLEDYQSKVE